MESTTTFTPRGMVVCEMVWFVGGLNHIAVFGARRLPQTRLDHLSYRLQVLNQSSLRSLQNMRREVLQLLLGLEIDHIARTRIAQRLKRRKRAV